MGVFYIFKIVQMVPIAQSTKDVTTNHQHKNKSESSQCIKVIWIQFSKIVF